jgi:WD40 repeat protein
MVLQLFTRAVIDSVMDLDWRSDTMFASSSVDQTICIWDANTPDMISQLKGHKASVADVVVFYDPDAKYRTCLGWYQLYSMGSVG